MDENKKKDNGRNKKLIIIISVTVLLAVTAVVSLMAAGIIPAPWKKSVETVSDMSEKSSLPEKSSEDAVIDRDYFNIAYERTVRHIKEAPATFPKIGGFLSKPFEQDIIIGLDSINPEFFDYLSDMLENFTGSEVNLNVQSDIQSRKISAIANVLTPVLQFEDYRLFLSKDSVMVKIPDLYDKNEYISINPKTFSTDYKNSLYNEMFPLFTDYNISPVISVLLGSVESNEGYVTNIERFSESAVMSAKELNKRAVFKDEGKDASGNRLISYTIKSEDTKEFFTQQLKPYKQVMLDTLETTYGSIPSYDIEAMNDEITKFMDEMIATLNTPNDLVITYTINADQLIVKAELSQFIVSVQPEYADGPLEAVFSFIIELNGKSNLSDDISMTVAAKIDGTEFAVNIAEVLKNPSDGAGREISIDVKKDDETYLSVLFGYIWNSAEKEENNFDADLELAIYNYDREEVKLIGADITGNMSESEDGFVFTDGQLSLRSGTDDIAVLTLGYSVKKIDEVLAPPTENSISLFDISQEDIPKIEDVLSLLGLF